jgi:hypothetical protein
MTEASLRKWHRRLGLTLALSIVFQAASGIVLNSETFSTFAIMAIWGNLLHRGGGDFGIVYRWVLGLGLIAMALMGSLIYLKIWQRTTKR